MDAIQMVVLFGVLYLVFWMISTYLRRRFSGEEADENDAPTATPRRSPDPSRYHRDSSPSSSASATVVCPGCGAENDPAYTFCHDCVSKLSSREPSASSGRSL